MPGRRPRRAVLAFRPALLRPPTRRNAALCSGTIAAAHGPLTFGGFLAAASGAATPRAASLAEAVVAHRLGGDCFAGPAPAFRRAKLRLLVADTGTSALDRLLQTGDAADIVIVAEHGTLAPAVARAGRAAGCLVIEETVDPWSLLDQVAEVHAPEGSDLAVLAGLAGIPGPARASLKRESLAAGHLLHGARYADPASLRAIGPEDFIDRMLTWRRLRGDLRRIACCVGVSRWKRGRVAEFAGTDPAFARTTAAALDIAQRRGGAIAVWSTRCPEDLPAAADAAGVAVYRMEDGFVRSRGLGADFVPPHSVVLDRRGIYYDPAGPSDLAHLLAAAAFPPGMLDRAARLRRTIVAQGITKYNLPGGTGGAALAGLAGKRVILVPGQVSDDRSVLAGGRGAAAGLDLLRRVRAGNPDAFIVYKPHPDVAAGHRPGAVPEHAARRLADLVIQNGPLAPLLDRVDEVHTLTSLTGFEALLRGRTVVTYGQPFYAGWGLTRDLVAQPHPRVLSLDELVAGVLILYPHYLHPVTLLPCGPEELIAGLAHAAPGHGGLIQLRRWQGAVRRFLAGWAARQA